MAPAVIPRPTLAVEIQNRWTIFHCSPMRQVSLKRFFRYYVPGSEFSPRVRSGAWDGYKHYLERGRVPTGLFLAQRSALEKKYKLKITDHRFPPAFRKVVTSKGERPYQKEIVEAMIANSNTGGILLCTMGSGKTRTTGEYLRRLKGYACFVVDELSLLAQAQRELSAILGEEVGIVGKSEFQPLRITVATVQTLDKHKEKSAFKEWFHTLDVLIIDEYHTMLNKRSIDVVKRVEPLAVFGLTATLQIEKPEIAFPAYALAGPVIYTYELSKGVEEGYLSKGLVCILKVEDPLRGRSPGYWTEDGGKRIWVASGSPRADYRYHISMNATRNRCIADLARVGVAKGKHVVILVERKTHLYVLSRRLADIPHRALCGDQSAEYRSEAMRMMDNDELPLIIASRIFSKGVDIRSVSMIIDGTALPGRNSTHQRYGRGTRLAEGKESLLHIDITDTHNRFSGAALSRRKALEELGNPIRMVIWEANNPAVMKRLTLD